MERAPTATIFRRDTLSSLGGGGPLAKIYPKMEAWHMDKWTT